MRPGSNRAIALLAPLLVLVSTPCGAEETDNVHPFAAMAGSWSGGGTLTTSSGERNRLRCRAHYAAGRASRSLQLSIRCASDSYNFDLASSIVEKSGRIHGQWSESNYNVAGTVSGRLSGDHIRATASSSSFTAGLALTTRGNRQSVSITPRDAFITSVHIALRKR
jgi:hypothetical protein